MGQKQREKIICCPKLDSLRDERRNWKELVCLEWVTMDDEKMRRGRTGKNQWKL